MEHQQVPPRMWLTRRAISLHLTLLIVVPVFLGLFWWQVQRVRQGNTLSWAYVFEWPFFTGYAVYLWWRLVHDQPGLAAAPAPGGEQGPGRAPAPPAARAPARTEQAREGEEGDGEDEELAAYNRYLAELNATGPPKRW